MFDVHRDDRLLVMAYTPSSGFGVDEVGSDDGFVTSYQYTIADFELAADQLRQLITGTPNRLGMH